jgi:hypothetical protein
LAGILRFLLAAGRKNAFFIANGWPSPRPDAGHAPLERFDSDLTAAATTTCLADVRPKACVTTRGDGQHPGLPARGCRRRYSAAALNRREGGGKPQEVPSVTITSSSQGKR